MLSVDGDQRLLVPEIDRRDPQVERGDLQSLDQFVDLVQDVGGACLPGSDPAEMTS